MMVCLKSIFSFILTTILGIALLIFLFFGGINYIKDNYIAKFYSSEPKVANVSKDLGNFSSIPKNYKLTKTIDMFGFNAVLAENSKNKQKMAVVNTGKVLNITKKDIQSSDIEIQLKDLASKIPYQPVNLNKLEVMKKGSFKALNQTIPYVRVNINLSGKSQSNLEGIIGVVDTPDKKNNLVISVGKSGEYNQKVAEDFFKKIK